METILEKGFRIIELDKNLFDGYLSEMDSGIWISAIKSKKIGNGDFSRLIKTSGIPKSPMSIGTSPIPSISVIIPKVKRGTPLILSSPMVPRKNPRLAIIRDEIIDWND